MKKSKTREHLLIEINQLEAKFLELEKEHEMLRLKVSSENEEKLLRVMSSMDDLVFQLDKENRIVWVNAPSSQLYLKPKIFLGKKPSEIMPKHISDLFNKAMIQVKNGKTAEYEYAIEIHDKIRWYAMKLSPILNNGKFVGSVSVARDITEYKQLDEALKISEEKFKNIVSSSPTAMYFYQLEEENRLLLIGANPSADKLTGIPHKTLIGKTIEEAFPGLIQTDILEMHKKIARKELGPQSFEIQYEDSNTSGYYEAYVFSTQSNTIAVEFVDIFDRKQAEMKLKESNEKLKELNATKDKLYSIISHDLRSPFNTILGYSDLLINSINLQKIDEILGYGSIINATAKNTIILLDNLLDWSKSQTGNINFSHEELMLSTIIDETIYTLDATTKSKNILLTFHKVDDFEVFADINMLKTILRNLISNAIKFTNLNGKIAIYTVKKNNMVEITISDNGIGMHPEKRDQLFTIGADITTLGTAGEKGSGLGLLLCKEFVEKQGGEIWVESNLGAGSDFKFTLPLKSIN